MRKWWGTNCVCVGPQKTYLARFLVIFFRQNLKLLCLLSAWSFHICCATNLCFVLCCWSWPSQRLQSCGVVEPSWLSWLWGSCKSHGWWFCVQTCWTRTVCFITCCNYWCLIIAFSQMPKRRSILSLVPSVKISLILRLMSAIADKVTVKNQSSYRSNSVTASTFAAGAILNDLNIATTQKKKNISWRSSSPLSADLRSKH